MNTHVCLQRGENDTRSTFKPWLEVLFDVLINWRKALDAWWSRMNEGISKLAAANSSLEWRERIHSSSCRYSVTRDSFAALDLYP